MVISYLGKQFFKVSVGDTVLAFNPVSKDSKHKASRFGADIALITVDHPDYNGAEMLTFGDKVPFVISGPGEYEIKEIFVKGVPSESSIKEKINTIYTLELDKINLCFLGTVAGKLPADSRAGIEAVDILFVPVSGALSASDVYQLAVSFEPKVIIPMEYEEGSESFKKFLKEGDAKLSEAVDKLTVKAKDIEGKEAEIIVLAPSNQ